MKKHFLRILVVMLMACLGIGVLAACGDGGEETPANETYTVEFSFGDPSHAATGAQLPAKQTEKKVGDAVALTTPAAAEEWKFDGWYAVSGKVDGATYTVKAADAVDGTITLTAHWAEDAPATQVTVTYSLGACGSTAYAGTTAVPGAVTVNAGTQVTLPDTPVWEGYDFLGWKVGNDATLKDAKAQITVNESVTVTAQWEAVPPADTYTVTYELGDHAGTTTVPTQEPVTSGTEIDLPTVQAAKGYRFKNWRVKNGDVISGTKYNVTGNVTIVAEWEPISYTVKYALNKPQDAQGTLSPASIADGAIAFGTPLSLPVDPSGLTNYTFTGWKTTGMTDPVKNSGSTTVTLTEAMIPNSGTEITLTAQWETVPPATTSIEGVWSGASGDFADFTVTVDVQGDTAHVIILKNADDSNFVCMYLQFEKGQDGNFALNGATLTVDEDGHLVYGMGIPGQSMTLTTQDPLPDALDLTGTKYAVQDVTVMDDVVEIGFGATPAIKHNGTAATGVKAIDVGGYKVFTGTVGSDAITVIAFKVDTAYYAAVLMGESNKDRFDLVDTAPTFSVRYEAGEAGSSATNMPDAVTQKFEVGATYTLSDKKPAWEGHKFLGWKASNGQAEGSPDGGNSDGNASANLYHEGGSYTFATPTNVTFTAQWEEDEPASTTSIQNVWTKANGAVPSYMGDGVPATSFDYEVSVELAKDGQSGYVVILMSGTFKGEDPQENFSFTFALGFAISKTGDNFTGTPKWESEGPGTLKTYTITFSVADGKLTITGFTDDPLVLDKERDLDENISPSGVLYSSEDNYEIDFTEETLKIDDVTFEETTFAKVGKFVLICYTGDSVGGADACLVVFAENSHYCYYGTEGGNTIELVTEKPQPTYTVQFAAGDHGSLNGDYSYEGKNDGAELSFPEPPTAEKGYRFTGWYDKDGNRVDGSDIQEYTVSADDADGTTITITAQYETIKYTIVFESGVDTGVTGSVDSIENVTIEEYEVSLTGKTGFSRTGYEFDGWTLNGADVGDIFNLTEDNIPDGTEDGTTITLTAKWTPKTYTVTLEAGTGTLPGENTVEATYNATLTLPAVTANKGYIFDGWYTTASGDGTKFESGSTTWTIDEESPTLYARYNYIEYTVEYAEGEKGSGTVTGMPTATAQKVSLKEGNTEITLPTSDPALEGFTFEGWSLNGKNIGKAGATYTITDADLPANPENPEDAKITLTALWKEEGKVLVTYQLGDHAASNATLPKDSENVTKNGTFTLPTDTETLKGETGYEFDGWYIGDRKLGATEQVEEADITVTAKFKAITYTVEFAKGEGEVEGTIDSVTVTIEANHNTVALSDKKEGYKRTDHRFAGWKFNETHTYEPEGTFTLTTDIIEALGGKTTITLTAQWNKVTYTVTYDYGEGANVDPAQEEKQVAWGETVTLETPAAKDGWEFDKWEVTGVEGYDNGNSFEMPKNAVTVTAQWNKVTYTVTYNYGEGTEQTEPKTAQYEWGAEVTLAQPAAKPGYEFAGWEVTEGGVELQDGNKFTMPKNAVTVTATWNKTEYTVTFVYGEGTDDKAPEATSYQWDAEVELTKPAAKAGWEFDKWEVTGADNVTVNEDNTFTMPQAAITVTAIFKPISYIVRYNLNKPEGAKGDLSVESITDGTIDIKTPLTLPDNPILTGATFEGWQVTGVSDLVKKGEGSTTLTLIEAIIKGATDGGEGQKIITFTAQWKELTYTVTYEAGDGYSEATGIPTDAESYKYKAAVTIAEGTPVYGGYTFEGWTVKGTDGATVYAHGDETHGVYEITDNVTFVAKWKENSYTLKFYVSEEDESPTTVTVTGRNAVDTKLPQDPSKQYYKFEGWFLEDDETKVDAAYAPYNKNANGAEIKVYAKWTFEAKVGNEDNSTGYTGFDESLFGWKGTIQSGEKIVLKGTQGSQGTNVWDGLVMYVYTATPTGAFRTDNFVLDEENLETAENWDITMYTDHDGDDDAAWLALLKNGNVTVTFDWTHTDTIQVMLHLENQTSGSIYTQHFIVTPKSSFAESYKVAIGCDHGHAVFTEYTQTKVEGGTQHDFSNGACSVCGLVCDHSGEEGTCSKCGATLVNETFNGTAYTDIHAFGDTTLRRGKKLMAWGTQTTALADAGDTVQCELEPGADGYTTRLDNLGWPFGSPSKFSAWKNTDETNGKSVSSLIVNRDDKGAVSTLDWFTTFKEVVKDSNWLIEVIWTKEDVIDIACHCTSNSGTYAGYTFEIVYNIKLVRTDLEEIHVRITAPQNVTSVTVNGYKVVESVYD